MTRKGIAWILVRLVASGAAGNLLGRRACQIYEAGDVDEGLVNTHIVWSWTWEGDGPLEEERWSLNKSFLGGEGGDTEMELRAWYVLGEYSTTELYHDLQIFFFFFLQRLRYTLGQLLLAY